MRAAMGLNLTTKQGWKRSLEGCHEIEMVCQLQTSWVVSANGDPIGHHQRMPHTQTSRMGWKWNVRRQEIQGSSGGADWPLALFYIFPGLSRATTCQMWCTTRWMKYLTHTFAHNCFSQSFSEKLLGGKMHLLDQCHEVQKLQKEVQRKPDRRYTPSQEVQRKPDRRYTQSQTRDTLYKKPNEVGK